MEYRQHIILGTGVLGCGVAACLASRGITPLLASRSGNICRIDGADWPVLACDPSIPAQQAQLTQLLAAPSVLYLCAAPAYARWQAEFAALADGVAAAVAGCDVRLIIADNVYAYGHCPDGGFHEGSASAPCSRKGRVREQAAQRLMALDAGDAISECVSPGGADSGNRGGNSRIRVAVVRGASFFGPGVSASSAGRDVVHSVMHGNPAYVIGDPAVAHSFTYVPDFAATMVAVAADERAMGGCWHAPSHSGLSLAHLLQRIAAHGAHPLTMRCAGPVLMRLLGLFNPAMRELREMMYLHDNPWHFSSTRTQQLLALRATPLDAAITATVAAVLAVAPLASTAKANQAGSRG